MERYRLFREQELELEAQLEVVQRHAELQELFRLSEDAVGE